MKDSPHGPVLASHLTSVAAKDNFSSTVEVRVRQPYAQWRYRLDVLVDGRPTYFDRYPQKVQHFQGVTVYTPSNILNQSHVVIMFQVSWVVVGQGGKSLYCMHEVFFLQRSCFSILIIVSTACTGYFLTSITRT